MGPIKAGELSTNSLVPLSPFFRRVGPIKAGELSPLSRSTFSVLQERGDFKSRIVDYKFYLPTFSVLWERGAYNSRRVVYKLSRTTFSVLKERGFSVL